MDPINPMQDKIIWAFRSLVDERELNWVEVRASPSTGTIRLQEPGEFRTLLKLEYEFETYACRLLIYRQSKPVGGRCGIDYDDGAAIERILMQFRCLLADTCRKPDICMGAA